MTELVFRFIVGGIVVSAFAVLGDLLKPNSFAGLFGAAPSVALATLGLTIVTNGKVFAAQESRSMIGGALALFVYANLCSRVLMRDNVRTVVVTTSLVAVWFFCAVSAWFVVLR